MTFSSFRPFAVPCPCCMLARHVWCLFSQLGRFLMVFRAKFYVWFFRHVSRCVHSFGGFSSLRFCHALLRLSTNGRHRRHRSVKPAVSHFYLAAVSLDDRCRSNGATWQVQGRAIRVTDPADHLAMIRSFCRTMCSCEEPISESSQSPSQRHRFWPRLQSPGYILDRSSNVIGTSIHTVYNLQDDHVGHQIFLACTSDPLGAVQSSGACS